ncbi:MAG: heme-binding protein, partial [Halobacteriaceae archaeon]
MPEAPPTAEGWYVSHDFRTVDWDAWRAATERERETALDDATDHLTALAEPEGDATVAAVLGHEADLVVVTLRPSMAALERATRAFEQTAFAGFTERTDSFTSVTEVSGYVSDAYFEEGEEVDPGIRNYVESKLSPEIPDGYLSFYPMSKRRHPEDNWYMLPIEERADLMAEHGETGRDHAGTIQQLITSALGFDDWEWGVTLFSDDPAAIKDVVYEMRFDEASARFAEFGPFYVARQFPPADLPAYMAGEAVPADGEPEGAATADGEPAATTAGGPPDAGTHDSEESEDSPVYGGQPHGEDVHARVVYSTADPDELATAVEELSESFDHYDTHRGTDVYENEAREGAPAAVVSRWDTAKAADIAAGFLADLPEATASADGSSPAAGADGGAEAGEDGAAADDGWGTMG